MTVDIYLDIETLPTTDPDVIAEIAKTITPPATMSKPETIAAWETEKKPELVKQAVAKTSFDGLYGSIACIAWAINDDDPKCLSEGGDEGVLLEEFFGSVERAIKKAAVSDAGTRTFIGHNIAEFDLQFLKHRAIIHGIKPPRAVLHAMTAKPWDSCIGDTMLMWSSSRERRVSLDKLCRALGVPGKNGFDGSMVAETWPVDPRKVMEYCMDDVRRVREVYERLVFR